MTETRVPVSESIFFKSSRWRGEGLESINHDDRIRTMADTNFPDFLKANPDGEICLVGHRIRLIDVAARYAGESRKFGEETQTG